MPRTTIEEMFNGPWGIVKKRRDEIETGSYGAFERIHKEEVDSNYLPVTKCAEILSCHPATARKWLRAADARHIVQGYRIYITKTM